MLGRDQLSAPRIFMREGGIAAAAKRRWRDPIYQAKTLAAHKTALADPNTKKAVWTDRQRALHQEKMRIMWGGKVGDRIRKVRLKRSRTPEFRAKMRKGRLDSWV